MQKVTISRIYLHQHQFSFLAYQRAHRALTVLHSKFSILRPKPECLSSCKTCGRYSSHCCSPFRPIVNMKAAQAQSCCNAMPRPALSIDSSTFDRLFSIDPFFSSFLIEGFEHVQRSVQGRHQHRLEGYLEGSKIFYDLQRCVNIYSPFHSLKN